MTDHRRVRAKKNIATSLLGQVVVLICGIIVPRLMIGAFGSEAYGATSSIAQFLAYITLLEGGVGGVARAVLYKPLSEGDGQTVSAIMREIKRFFRIVAVIFLAYVLVVAVSFRSVSHIVSMDWISTFWLVLVISISTFSQYFIGISHSILLQAAQKSYVTNLVSIGTTALNAVAVAVLIGCGCDLITVKLVSSLVFALRPVVLSLYVRKYYATSREQPPSKTKYLTKKWTGLSQHIAYFLHSNTDIAVLTLLADLRTVAVYAVYNMIISHLQALAVSFASGMEAVFGDMLAREEKDRLHSAFQGYETILSLVSVVLFSVAAVLILPFVRLYTAGITDADYIQPLFAFLLILTAQTFCLRQPYHAMVIAAGHFKETRMAAYGEAGINILLSLALVLRYGLVGVAIGTLVATWFRFAYYVLYLSKHICNRRISLFLKRLLVNVIAFALSGLGGYGVVMLFPMEHYWQWALCGAVLVVIAGACTLIMNGLFYRKECGALIRKLLKR